MNHNILTPVAPDDGNHSAGRRFVRKNERRGGMAEFELSKPHLQNQTVAPRHRRDADCTVNPETRLCTSCGADHSTECRACGGRAFHLARCPFATPNDGRVAGPAVSVERHVCGSPTLACECGLVMVKFDGTSGVEYMCRSMNCSWFGTRFSLGTPSTITVHRIPDVVTPPETAVGQ